MASMPTMRRIRQDRPRLEGPEGASRNARRRFEADPLREGA